MVYADPAAWAEKYTDAGTRDAHADPGPIDDVPYDDDELGDLSADACVVWAAVGGWCWLVIAYAAGWLA